MQFSDNWFDIEKIDDQTFAISEHGHWEDFNAYLLLSGTEALLIDTGLGVGNIKEVCEHLTTNKIKVLTTHTHWDHIGGHRLFDEIYVHEAEVDWLVNGVPDHIHAEIDSLKPSYFTKPMPEGFVLENYQRFQGKPSRVLTDGEVLQLGDRSLEILHTPGHSPGHICIWEEKSGYLFSGDLLYQGTLFLFFESTDPLTFAKSVNRIASIEGIKRIFPSHNQFGFDASFINRVQQALESLQANNDLAHGTGVHEFEDFSIKL